MANRGDSYNPVQTVQSQGVGGAGINVHATPGAFGAQIAQATSQVGAQGENISEHFAQMSTEAKVNDDYANKYIPKAAELKKQYDSLQGQDKVAGYNNYIKQIDSLNDEFKQLQPSPMGQEAMGTLVNRYKVGEITGATSQLVDSQKILADKASFDRLLVDNGVAAQNYNNPEIVTSIEKQNNNTVIMQHIDNGHDPNDSHSKVIIEDAQNKVKGNMAKGMITSALNSNDPHSANTFRSRYASVMPGYEKLHIDNVLHNANLKYTGQQGTQALMVGKPLPEAIGAPPSQVQALVANTAKSSEVDPNHALTVLRIESANGQNVGDRGTLGQDKESAGKPIEDQAKTLCDNLRSANNRANTVLGRQSEPWEAYTIYQQGSGGGAALLQADRNAKAIDILTPFYDSPKTALKAITGNGGNSTMTVGDFNDHIKQVWDDNAKRANCDFTNIDNPGEALIKPHQATGEVVQPGASPVQTWLNFEKKYPAMMAQINAIPNYEVRDTQRRMMNETRADYAREASGYKNVLLNQAAKFIADPKFTSMDQVPPDMQAALFSDHPESITHLQKAADAHANSNSALPLDFSNISSLGSQIGARVDSANLQAFTTGKPLQIFTKQDTDKLSNAWQTQNTAQRLNFLTVLHESVSNQEDFQHVIQQIRPDSPVTAIAGGFVGLDSKIRTNHWFSADTEISAQAVAQRLLEGEELLNPTKSDKKEGGVGKVFPMPKDDGSDGLRQEFNNYVGDAFRGTPATYHQAYQAYRAYYAASAAKTGDYSGNLDTSLSAESARSVLGNVIDKNNNKVIAPWGMEEDTFNDLGKIQLDEKLTSNGYDPETFKWKDVKLQNKVGQSGTYLVMMGAGYLLDKEGQPLTINMHLGIPTEAGGE